MAGEMAVQAAEPDVPLEHALRAGKLMPPRLDRSALRRRRLLDLLHDHLEKRVTAVVAPAGYGKTTLLAQFVEEVDALTCWCTLDEHDRDAVALMVSLVAAVARRVPGFGARVRASLATQLPGSDDERLRAAVGLFLSELEEVRDFLVLVVDDCHAIGGSEAGNAVLSLLAEGLPGHCHLILAGRSVADVAAIPKLVRQRQAARLTEALLRLTPEETETLLSVSGISSAAGAPAEAVYAQTQGWPIAVTLLAAHAAESGADLSGDHDRPPGSDSPPLPLQVRDELFAYLAGEVLAHQPPMLQTLLLSASVLPCFQAERCAALTGRPVEEVQRLLAAALARNLFLTRLEAPLPGEGREVGRLSLHEEGRAGGMPLPPGEAGSRAPEWPDGPALPEIYRFHDLFRAFLLETLRAQQPVRYRWLERRASQLAEAAGDLAGAVAHALAGRHFARAARLIERAAPECRATGRWATLRHWLACLPERTLDARPQLLVEKARVIGPATGGLPILQALLDRAERLLPGGATIDLLLLRAQLIRQEGRYQEAEALARRALNLLVAVGHGDTSPLAAEISLSLATCAHRLGRFAEARVLYERASVSASPSHCALAHDGIALAELMLGRLEVALAHFRRAKEAWLSLGNEMMLARTLNNLGLAQHYLGDYSAAAQSFEEALRLARRCRLPHVESCVLLSLGDLELDRGAVEAAAARYQCGLALAETLPNAYLVRYATGALGQVARLRGELDRAEILARQAVHEARACGSRHEEGAYLRMLALVRLERGEIEAARQALEAATGLLAACGARRELAQARFTRAQVALAAGRELEAVRALGALEALLAELGYHGFLLGEARRAMHVLDFAAARVPGARLAALRAAARQPLEAGERALASPAPEPARASTAAEAVPGPEARDEELPRLEVWSFGHSRVRCLPPRGRPREPNWRTGKCKELLFYLLCHPGWQRRQRIALHLWPDATPEQARSGFHANSHRLRRELFDQIIEEHRGCYRLNPRVRYWFDAEEFERCCRRLAGGGADSIEAAHEAVRLYQGPFLDDLAPDWAEPARQRFEALYLEAVLHLARHYAAQGDYERAIEVLEEALEIDPAFEPVHELLVECRSGAGMPAAALHHLHTYAATLGGELDEEAGRRAHELHRRLLRDAGAAALPRFVTAR